MASWKFFYESKDTDCSFIIEADEPEDAFDKAFEKYGPQVNHMVTHEL